MSWLPEARHCCAQDGDAWYNVMQQKCSDIRIASSLRPTTTKDAGLWLFQQPPEQQICAFLFGQLSPWYFLDLSLPADPSSRASYGRQSVRSVQALAPTSLQNSSPIYNCIMPSQVATSRRSQFLSEDDNTEVSGEQDFQLHRSRSAQIQKPSGACVDCKSVKVRCEFVPGEKKCRRCQTKNLPCHPRERKKRKPADTHEQLQERSHEQDLHIQNLLLQYDQRKAEQKVHQWVSKASSSTDGPMDILQRRQMHKGKSPEFAAISYFSFGFATEQMVPPPIVRHCSLYPEDIEELFSLYHTPQKLIWTSPFLFTVICAVASRYYTARPNLYSLAMEFARDCAGKGLVEGVRSVEVCQAYLIMAMYPEPKKKWAEDRSWLLIGVAIRMAIELELNQPPSPLCEERETLNRTRTWLICYCTDGSHAIQFGKIPMIPLDDYLARNSRDWYKSSALNTPADMYLCAFVQLLLHVAKWRAGIRLGSCGREDELKDIVDVALGPKKLSIVKWKCGPINSPKHPCLCQYFEGSNVDRFQRTSAYLRLVVLMAGFQKTQAEDLRPDSEILVKSIEAARSVIQVTLERLYPTGCLRYALQSSFLYISFAAAFLINLFRPRYVPLLDDSLRKEIISMVSHLVMVLGSPDVALDVKHTPALYSRFLASLMVDHNLVPDHVNVLSRKSYREDRHSTPSNGFSWPDVPNTDSSSEDDFSQPRGFVGQGQQIPLDFSLSNFMRAIAEQPPLGEVEQSEPWQFSKFNMGGAPVQPHSWTDSMPLWIGN
ncbi:hypothetical protein CPB84DRAFT_1746799 [Gymnopilus junonius]|uniref:Zn(2)-C6 fungal-type domain-containing protein n=1 Tax=Gymnopilus junonius TaxID=109634 RepID=A0A9P5NM59_GYMJU|nr:hypothetical protein CPB84DRAFT_1746799 [Gymnopilus junonius]